MPTLCDKSKDIVNDCDSANLNLESGLLAVRREAVKFTKNATNPFLLDKFEVVDPDTGEYPVALSKYLPIKIDWYLNSNKANYEVVEGTSTPDRYSQTVGNIVVTDSESAVGKLNVKALNSNLWVVVSKLKGVSNQNDTFHVYGLQNGLKFLPAPTADEFGGRVVGMFKSVPGAEESTPNGVNLLDTNFETTNTLFGQRFEPVVIP